MLSAKRALPLLCLVAVVSICDGTDAAEIDSYWLRSWNVAQALRPASLQSSARIAPAGEPGLPLVIRGRVFEPGGREPAAGVVVHAYHRDAAGFDFGANDSELATWRLQGWLRTDADGRFEFTTIRPAPDHLGREGPHVHFTTEASRFGRQWAPTVYLADEAGSSDRAVLYVDVNIERRETADF